MTDFETYADPEEEENNNDQSPEKSEIDESRSSQESEAEIQSVEEDEEEEEKEVVIPPLPVPSGPKRAVRNDDLVRLDHLRKKLANLQSESNDIMKYNSSSMFNKQKFLAMERLQELENNFKDFNIDFAVSDPEDKYNFNSNQVLLMIPLRTNKRSFGRSRTNQRRIEKTIGSCSKDKITIT